VPLTTPWHWSRNCDHGRPHSGGSVRPGSYADAAVTSAWSRYPGYRIDLVPLEGTGRVHGAGRLVAESNRCLIVRESDHLDQLYFPREDIAAAALVETDHHTICPSKGDASYASLSIAGTMLENALWWYPNPMDEVAGLAGYASFHIEQVEVTASLPLSDGLEATVKFPIWGTVGDLASAMDVSRLSDGTFTAPPYPNPPVGTFFSLAWHKERRVVIEGGQLLGAAIVAASKSRPDQRVTSAHVVFVKSASFDEPLQLAVDARRLGSTLSLFDVKMEQGNALRASALVMTDVGADDLIRHGSPMPEVPGQSECPPLDMGVLGRDIRVVDSAYSQRDGPVGPPELYVWTRFASPPQTNALHQALLAQPTTHYSIAAAMRPHEGISEDEAHRRISTGPVSATIAFHDEIDVTDWMLTETRAIWAGRGSIQYFVRVFAADGRLVASKTIQAIVRTFDRTLKQMGQGYATVM
jgi:acyl-CoA thioesterase-2